MYYPITKKFFITLLEKNPSRFIASYPAVKLWNMDEVESDVNGIPDANIDTADTRTATVGSSYINFSNGCCLSIYGSGNKYFMFPNSAGRRFVAQVHTCHDDFDNTDYSGVVVYSV